MGRLFSQEERSDLRERLIAVIQAGADRNGSLSESADISLIASGQLDSLGLYNVALFVEREVGRKLNLGSFDLAAEWDTVEGILDFIQKLG